MHPQPSIFMNSLNPGAVLDHYQIEELIARSGMASIFRATDSRTGATVALKIPHPEAEADVVFFERFQREKEIGQTLDHPYVMKVLQDQQASQVYMVMEWLNGRLLRKILFEEKTLPAKRALGLTQKICEALDYIHENGIVHRDLKPENIIVDDRDNIKLIDFGIAGKEGARRLTFGRLSELMGTPDYISPEQVKGKRGDCRSDIYALGVMFYEMLTGRLPFLGTNPFAIMNDRVLNNPIPPSEVEPSVSPELQEIIYRALARDPRNRYATARDFADDLSHPDQVKVADRPELYHWKQRRAAWPRQWLVFILLGLVPVIIFVLLLIAAHHSRP
jgi:serine/threonine-protein kinase